MRTYIYIYPLSRGLIEPKPISLYLEQPLPLITGSLNVSQYYTARIYTITINSSPRILTAHDIFPISSALEHTYTIHQPR